MMVLVVSGVLLVTAAATLIFGGGFDDATPHGKLLSTLETVAEAQEAHHRQTGEFAAWPQSLDIETSPDVELTLVRGGMEEWEALAKAPDVGLSCSQRGSWSGGLPVRERPVCYREDG